MITRISQRILVSTLGLILLGFVMGNMILIYVGFIPVIYASIGFIIKTPKKYEVNRYDESLELFIGDRVTVKKTIKISKGLGPLIVYEKLPREFKLVNGSNIHVYWKGFEPITKQYEYEYECSRRGVYETGSVSIQGLHPFNLYPPNIETLANNQELVINPKPSIVKKVRRRQQYTLFPLPSESRIKLGAPTLDFREIRQYNHGDPYKNINWKATARLGTSPWKTPAVNEYEREGRRVVWIFLDKSNRLRLGNSINNSFEYAVQAATSLVEYYIVRQCKVGFAEFQTYPYKPIQGMWLRQKIEEVDSVTMNPDILYPESGQIQLYKINRRLLEVKTDTIGTSLLQIVQHAKRYLQGTNPLFIVITNLTHERVSDLRSSLDEMMKYSRRLRGQRINALIINVSGYFLASNTNYQKMAAALLQLEEKEFLRDVASPTVSVINWDPTSQDIVERMMEAVKSVEG